MDPRVVFMGSPEFAIPALRMLNANYRLVGVITQPDRPAGRGRRVTPPPVKTLALELDLPLIQPRRLREPAAMDKLRSWKPDIIVVAAFGQILRPDVLELPVYGCLNVHASLLPRWRGAAPIQAAILHGDRETGVTIMLMDPGVDTGPVLSQRATPILPDENAAGLSDRLATLGAELLLDTLPGYLEGEIKPTVQDNARATYAPMLQKKDGELDFRLSAEDLAMRVRAYNPWPGAYTYWHGQRLIIHEAYALHAETPGPGVTAIAGDHPAIGAGIGSLVLQRVQPAGKQSMPGDIFMRGAREWAGYRLPTG